MFWSNAFKSRHLQFGSSRIPAIALGQHGAGRQHGVAADHRLVHRDGTKADEAAVLDPQHRKFLETAWQALENAGHTADDFAGRVGVYAGCGAGTYLYRNLLSNPDLVDDLGPFQLRNTGNDKDFLSTRVSHVLDLRGPSINIQTACSTALVGVHQAAKALRDGLILWADEDRLR